MRYMLGRAPSDRAATAGELFRQFIFNSFMIGLVFWFVRGRPHATPFWECIVIGYCIGAFFVVVRIIVDRTNLRER